MSGDALKDIITKESIEKKFEVAFHWDKWGGIICVDFIVCDEFYEFST